MPRNYKEEYRKYQSGTKNIKKRSKLNKINRDKGTYGNGDGKDVSHMSDGSIVLEDQSKNRGNGTRTPGDRRARGKKGFKANKGYKLNKLKKKLKFKEEDKNKIVDPKANTGTDEINTEGLLRPLRLYGDPIESDFMRDNPEKNPENIIPRNYGKDMLDYYTNDGSGVNDPNSMFNRRLSGEFINDPDLLELEGGMSSDDRERMLSKLSKRTVFDTTYNEREKYKIMNQLAPKKDRENWDEEINPNTGEKYKDMWDWMSNSKQGRTLKRLGRYNDFPGSHNQPLRGTFNSEISDESKSGKTFINVNNYRELLQSRGEDPDDPKYKDLYNYIVMNPGQIENFTKNNNSKYADEYNTTYAHEMGHSGYGGYLSERDEGILKKLNRSDDNLEGEHVSDHHSDTVEIHADLSAIRQDMIDKGIYDYKAGQMTKKDWQQYLNSYPEGKYPLVLKRTLERYRIPDTDNPDKNIIYINNAIAMENEAGGGNIESFKTFDDGGEPIVKDDTTVIPDTFHANMDDPLTEGEIKEFKKLFKEDEFKMATGEATPMSLLDLIPTKAGSILGTKMLSFFNKTLGKTRSYFRGIGKEGFKDLKKYKAFRPKQVTDVKKTKVGDNKFDLDRTGTYRKDKVTGQSTDTYVSGEGNIETGRGYARRFSGKKDPVTGEMEELYPQFMAQFDNLDEVLKSQGRKLKTKNPKSRYFTGDLPVDQSNARIIKYSGPDDKFGTTVADFRNPLIGRLPIPTTPIVNKKSDKK